MIGTIDVKVQAHNPNFPLDPVFTFVNSSQSFRIRDVPKRIGNWSITNVFVNITYPDNTVFSKECLLVGGVWVGTVNGCSSSGQVEKGFVVTASGIDENNQTVSNYVLGAGDIYVKQLDGTVTPGKTSIRMFFYETIPTSPNEGDSTFIEGVLNVYDGTQWKPVAQQSDPSYIEDSNGNKIEADRDVIYTDNTKWSVNMGSYGTYVLSPTSIYSWEYAEPEGIEENKKVVLSYRDGENSWFLEYYQWNIASSIWNIIAYGYDYESSSTATSLEITITGDTSIDCTLTRGVVITDKLATLSDLPTKTSDLINDSGFITSSYVHGDYIENTDGDKISANRNYEFNRPLTCSWTLNYSLFGQDIQLNWLDEMGIWFYEGSNYKPSSPRMERVLLYYASSDNIWRFYSEHYDESIQVWVGNEDNTETTAPEDSENISFSNGASISRTLSGSGTLALTSEIPTKTSDLTNDSNFITSEQVEPFYNFGSTAGTGTARYTFALRTVNSAYNLDEDGEITAVASKGTDLSTSVDVTANYRGYSPWELSQFFQRMYSPALKLIFTKGSIKKLVGGRPRQYYDGYMFRTADIGFAMPCSEEGLPDGRLIEFTQVTTTYIAFTNEDAQVHTITLSGNTTSVETIDGQSGQITCSRQFIDKRTIYSATLATKDDLPTKTSDLTNDSGFITSTQVEPLVEPIIANKRDLLDMNVRGTPTNDGSWFNINDGTLVENAYWYDGTRWMTGTTFEVDITSTTGMFELKKNVNSEWISLGTFSLDDKYEATLTVDNVTYTIVGYVDIIATQSWVRNLIQTMLQQ